MSMVNADSVQLFAMLKKMQDSISSIETTKKSVKMKYEQLGAGWQDKKYNELGVVVRDCNKALNDILVIMLQAEKYVALLAKSLSEYESVQLGSTNGISASTPQTSSFAVTPSSADTTTFESNTFGSNLAFVQDRLSAERYFSRGNHYEEYRDYWENGNYTFSRNENPELVYVRARDIEGVYLSDRELGNPEGFWTHGKSSFTASSVWSRWRHATKTLGKRRSIAVSTTAPKSRWPFPNRMSRYRQTTNRSGRGIGWMPRPTVQGRL